LFLSMRVFSSCIYLCSIVVICACVFLLCVTLFNCFYLFEENTRTDKNNWTKIQTRGKHTHRYKQLNKSTIKKKTHTQMKTIEQRHIQEVNVCFPLVCTFVPLFLSVRVFSSCMYLCSIVFICACVFLLYVPLFNYFYLCMCFLLVCTFVQLFLSVRLFSYKRKTHAQIKTMEQRYKQEENKPTDRNNWTKVQTRGKHTHR
jgi:hypothetical protein